MAEVAEGEESSECLSSQVVQGVMAKTKPLYIVQALVKKLDCVGVVFPAIVTDYGECALFVSVCSQSIKSRKLLSTWKAMLGMVLVMGNGEHAEETKLCQSSRLDLLHTVFAQM